MYQHDWIFDLIRELSDTAEEAGFYALSQSLENSLDIYLGERERIAQGVPMFRSRRGMAAAPALSETTQKAQATAGPRVVRCKVPGPLPRSAPDHADRVERMIRLTLPAKDTPSERSA